jgi:hypothetical protein
MSYQNSFVAALAFAALGFLFTQVADAGRPRTQPECNDPEAPCASNDTASFNGYSNFCFTNPDTEYCAAGELVISCEQKDSDGISIDCDNGRPGLFWDQANGGPFLLQKGNSRQGIPSTLTCLNCEFQNNAGKGIPIPSTIEIKGSFKGKNDGLYGVEAVEDGVDPDTGDPLIRAKLVFDVADQFSQSRLDTTSGFWVTGATFSFGGSEEGTPGTWMGRLFEDEDLDCVTTVSPADGDCQEGIFRIAGFMDGSISCDVVDGLVTNTCLATAPADGNNAGSWIAAADEHNYAFDCFGETVNATPCGVVHHTVNLSGGQAKKLLPADGNLVQGAIFGALSTEGRGWQDPAFRPCMSQFGSQPSTSPTLVQILAQDVSCGRPLASIAENLLAFTETEASAATNVNPNETNPEAIFQVNFANSGTIVDISQLTQASVVLEILDGPDRIAVAHDGEPTPGPGGSTYKFFVNNFVDCWAELTGHVGAITSDIEDVPLRIKGTFPDSSTGAVGDTSTTIKAGGAYLPNPAACVEA